MDLTTETRNPNLRAALRTYAFDAIEMIRTHDWGSTGGLPAHLRQKAKITEQGMSVDLAAEVDWPVVLVSCEADLRQLSSYKAAENEMRSDNQVARHLDTMVGDGQVMVRVDIHTCLSGLLHDLLVDQKDAFFNEEKFNRIYREMEEYFYGDTLRRRVIASLTDFEMDAETITLGGGLSIIRLARAEREEFASRALMFPLPPFGSLGPTGWEEFALELHIEVPKVIGKGVAPSPAGGLSQAAAERFDEAITGLRLFKAGAVAYNSTSATSIAWEPHGGGGSIVKPPAFGGPRYVLPKDEIPAFEYFWRNFRRQRSKRRPRIDLALRRFNLAYERVLPEDRLIDYAIALEALLLRGDEQQELSYRLALRGSMLLGENPDARIEIFSRLRTAYSVRSNVVHGGSPPAQVSLGSTDVPFHQFVEEIAGYVRSAIRNMLALTESTKKEVDVISGLDERVVRGSPS